VHVAGAALGPLSVETAAPGLPPPDRQNTAALFGLGARVAVHRPEADREQRQRDEARAAATRALLTAGPAALSHCGSLATLRTLLEHWEAMGEQPGDAWWAAVERCGARTTVD
jgi:hypothetical protein